MASSTPQPAYGVPRHAPMDGSVGVGQSRLQQVGGPGHIPNQGYLPLQSKPNGAGYPQPPHHGLVDQGMYSGVSQPPRPAASPSAAQMAPPTVSHGHGTSHGAGQGIGSHTSTPTPHNQLSSHPHQHGHQNLHQGGPVSNAPLHSGPQTHSNPPSAQLAPSNAPDGLMKQLEQLSADTWFDLGRMSEEVSLYDKAVTCYETALKYVPYSVPILSALAGCYRQREQFAKAVETYESVLQLSPNNGEVWAALGHCYLMTDDLAKSHTAYQQALAHRDRRDPRLWYGIGILYDRYGTLDYAEDAFAQVLTIDSQFEKAQEVYFRLGIIYKQQGRHKDALDCFRYILGNPPTPLTSADVWFQIGHVYEQQQAFDQAHDAYERVLAENPHHAKVLQQLGWLSHEQEKYDVATMYLTRSLEAESGDAQSWYLLGRCYMAQQKYSKAYEAYQQAVYRNSRNPTFWCSIGVLYYQINQYRDALDAYSRAISINPHISEVWYDLGTLYESCNGQINDALYAYQRAAQLDPGNKQIQDRLDHLQSQLEHHGGQDPSVVVPNRPPVPMAQPVVRNTPGMTGPPGAHALGGTHLSQGQAVMERPPEGLPAGVNSGVIGVMPGVMQHPGMVNSAPGVVPTTDMRGYAPSAMGPENTLPAPPGGGSWIPTVVPGPVGPRNNEEPVSGAPTPLPGTTAVLPSVNVPPGVNVPQESPTSTQSRLAGDERQNSSYQLRPLKEGVDASSSGSSAKGEHPPADNNEAAQKSERTVEASPSVINTALSDVSGPSGSEGAGTTVPVGLSTQAPVTAQLQSDPVSAPLADETFEQESKHEDVGTEPQQGPPLVMTPMDPNGAEASSIELKKEKEPRAPPNGISGTTTVQEHGVTSPRASVSPSSQADGLKRASQFQEPEPKRSHTAQSETAGRPVQEDSEYD